jgi:hypothetical protein
VIVVCGQRFNDHGWGVVGVVWRASFVGGRHLFLGSGSSFVGRLLVVVLVSGPRLWAVHVVCGWGVVALYGGWSSFVSGAHHSWVPVHRT